MGYFFVRGPAAFAIYLTHILEAILKVRRRCAQCLEYYITTLSTSEYCTASCRGKAHRQRKKQEKLNATDLPRLQLLPAPLHEYDVPVSVLPRILPEGSSPQEKA